ncbi:MAG: hypothetical protein DDT27_01198 [Dehalococcoidia bacterium]|nr:hypothetical protein [Chloroflexota bacterium]MBT9162639.1 hypothetical protein [Chloroflexota bacterium]
MLRQTETDKYREEWLKAEREVLISEFQTDNLWAWQSMSVKELSSEPSSERLGIVPESLPSNEGDSPRL